jgi:hypothetical protein
VKWKVKCLYGNNNNNNERQKRLRRMGRGKYVENDIKKGEVGKDRWLSFWEAEGRGGSNTLPLYL